MNSARPHVVVAFSGSASARSPPPSSAPTTRSAPPAAYATNRPSGEGRGSITGPGTVSSRAVAPRSSATNSRPDSANAANSTVASTAYATTPAEPSRLRSRRARSSADSSSSAPPSRVRGSAAGYSRPSSTSSTHRTFARSVPPRDRRKTTREPSGDTEKARGAPSENRCVRAYCRGKEGCPVMGLVMRRSLRSVPPGSPKSARTRRAPRVCSRAPSHAHTRKVMIARA